jgi:hypothetical protein
MTKARAVPVVLAMLAAVGFGLLGWLDYSDRHTVESYSREMSRQTFPERNYLHPLPDRSAYTKAMERRTSRKGVEVLLTGILIAAAFFIIASKRYDLNDKRWAYALIGMIVGYWLRG